MNSASMVIPQDIKTQRKKIKKENQFLKKPDFRTNGI
jgi:hypothetical protein